MKFNNLVIFIPAIKKSVAFEDDLIRKLNGISLIQRTIFKAFSIVNNSKKVILFTDSEEIKLIAQRNNANFYYDHKLLWQQSSVKGQLLEFIKNNTKNSKFVLIISPYAPLLSKKILIDAINYLVKNNSDVLRPISFKKLGPKRTNKKHPLDFVFKIRKVNFSTINESFSLFKSNIINQNRDYTPKIINFDIQQNIHEINSFEDWWICEKLLKRKKIIIRVIGDNFVGLGHVYRCLSIAHEITDHSIEFITTKENNLAIKKLSASGYHLTISSERKIEMDIINNSPSLLINDILNTKSPYIKKIQKNKIKILNFEDLGSGAKNSDLTINELYEKPKLKAKNILWGNRYFFLRDEFNDAKKNRWKNSITSLLLTFGGTDQNNFSKKIYIAIKDLCKKHNIYINIVTGPGYENYEELRDNIKNDYNTVLTRSTGVISSIMEKCQIAIISNGRTVYELAHMNIPALIISHHERETTHNFSSEENGFIPLGIYKKGHTEKIVKQELNTLILDKYKRKRLHSKMQKFDFKKNKKKVMKKISDILKGI